MMNQSQRPQQATAAPKTTPSQTVGPFFALPDGLPWSDGPELVSAGAADPIVVHGHLFDGAGEPVPDGLIEIWQADEHGRFDHPDDPRGMSTSFRGFGRCATGAEGQFHFRTVKPGPLPAPDGATEAPHINVSVLARGMLARVVTRIYFPDEREANAADPVLRQADPRRAAGLIASGGPDEFHFDIRLQGDDETIFFKV